jgi:hypothetical protein
MQLLKKLARTYQSQIINYNDKIIISQQQVIKSKIESCILGKVGEDNLSHYYFNMLKYLYTSTQLRSLRWSNVEGNLGGYSYEVQSSEQTIRLQRCSEI